MPCRYVVIIFIVPCSGISRDPEWRAILTVHNHNSTESGSAPSSLLRYGSELTCVERIDRFHWARDLY